MRYAVSEAFRRRIPRGARVIVGLGLVLALVLFTTPGAFASGDSLDSVLDEVDPTAPPPPPPPPGSTPGAGQVNVQLLRVLPAAYADGISSLAGPARRSPRDISNLVLSQSGSILNEKNASDLLWDWGQFVDHDIDLTNTSTDPNEQADIPVPPGDQYFDPSIPIPFSRSVFDPNTGTDTSNPRQQINNITAFQDASTVYGVDAARLNALRTNDGTGKLKTSAGDFLPYNTYGLPNAPDPSDANFFLAGDVRANEQVGLTSLHTLFVREHNQICDRLMKRNSNLTGDQLFNTARLIVEAEIQSITYNEFLPILLGDNAIPPYTGYKLYVNPNISSVFSTAAYRLGHTMLSSVIRRLDRHGNTIPEGDLPLRDAFFAPTRITEAGISPIFRGLASQPMQRVDAKLVDDVRNFLFGPPPSPGLDLASLNIQRGRDHGLPDYNSYRIAYGFNPAASFADITSDPAVQAQLDEAYFGDVEDVDPWVGMIAEDHISSNELIGPLIYAILVDQFTRLRDGNPDFYLNVFTYKGQRAIEKNTLFEIITRNSQVGKGDIQRNVFIAP